jgi:hypothetical protein
MTPEQQQDPKSIAQAEAAFGKCMAKTSKEHLGLLKDVLKGVDTQLKGLK